jgi:hypothetical protein
MPLLELSPLGPFSGPVAAMIRLADEERAGIMTAHVRQHDWRDKDRGQNSSGDEDQNIHPVPRSPVG